MLDLLYAKKWLQKADKKVYGLGTTATAAKTSLTNQHLRNSDYFVIIPSYSHFKMWCQTSLFFFLNVFS